jgi:hypothetical protein
MFYIFLMAFILSQISPQTSLNDFNWLMTKQKIKNYDFKWWINTVTILNIDKPLLFLWLSKHVFLGNS